MTATDDHGMLPVHAERLVSRLQALEGLAIHGETLHLQHSEYAKRSRQLAAHLRAVMQMTESRHYASALVVMRAALEHHLLDRLIFLATRYIVIYPKAKRREAVEWEARLAAAQAGEQPDIAAWFWDQDGLNVVRRGLHTARSKKGRGQTISSYYFSVDHFDPFLGPKRHAGRLAAPFQPRTRVQRRADESASAWKYLVSYRAMMKALRVNRLLLGKHI